jgi:hypothetical protein
VYAKRLEQDLMDIERLPKGKTRRHRFSEYLQFSRIGDDCIAGLNRRLVSLSIVRKDRRYFRAPRDGGYRFSRGKVDTLGATERATRRLVEFHVKFDMKRASKILKH